MKTYVDTSVILRVILGQAGQLAGWDGLDAPVTSALTEVECLRTLDRLHRQGALAEAMLAERRALALRIIGAMDRVAITPAVLRRTADPFPTALGTLDAIHLSSALLWTVARSQPLVMATHDVELARAARAMGLEVIGA